MRETQCDDMGAVAIGEREGSARRGVPRPGYAIAQIRLTEVGGRSADRIAGNTKRISRGQSTQ